MLVIGIDIGGTSIKIGLVNREGQILEKRIIPVKDSSKEKQFAIADQMADTIISICEDTLTPLLSLEGIGIGCPGFIDSTRGSCDYSINLGWENFLIAPYLQKKLGIPAKITNDANAGVLGEAFFGSAKGHKNVILLTLGTGVGSGLILDGKIFEGNKGKGAELGHALLVRGGKPCACGRNGCVEAYVSATALIEQTKSTMKDRPESLLWKYAHDDIDLVDGSTAFEAMKKGDTLAKRIIRDYTENLGETLLNFINIFWPDIIVLGGGISGQKEALTDPVNAYLKEHEIKTGGFGPSQASVVVSNLGNDAGILGAAALFF